MNATLGVSFVPCDSEVWFLQVLLDGRHQGLVHLKTTLVGPSCSCLPCQCQGIWFWDRAIRQKLEYRINKNQMIKYFLPYKRISRLPDDRIYLPLSTLLLSVIYLLLHYYEGLLSTSCYTIMKGYYLPLVTLLWRAIIFTYSINMLQLTNCKFDQIYWIKNCFYFKISS